MALIQISDPDKVISQKKQFSVGIDLGTTNSLIAECTNGEISFFEDNQSKLIPSVIYESNNKLQVGSSKNKESIKSIKRLIGLTSNQTSNINFKNMNLDLKGDLPLVCINNQKLSAIEISSKILSHLCNVALKFKKT